MSIPSSSSQPPPPQPKLLVPKLLVPDDGCLTVNPNNDNNKKIYNAK